MTEAVQPWPADLPPAEELQQALAQLMQMAFDFQQSGQSQQAAALYQAIVEAQPDHPEANHQLGLLMWQTHGPGASLAFLDAALKADPQQPAYWLGYIEALREAGHADAARQVLALGRQHGLQGEAANQLAAHLDAQALLERDVAKRMDPQAAERTGVFLDRTLPAPAQPTPSAKSAKSTQSANKKARRKGPQHAPSDEDIARVTALFTQGRLTELERLARTLCQRWPQHGYGWKVLGATLAMQGLVEEAVPCLHKAVQWLPGDAEALNNLGNTLLQAGQLAEAEASLRQALAIRPGFAEAHSNLGNTLYAQDRLSEAQASLQRALQLKPDFAEACSNLGYVLKDLGLPAQAEASLLRALALRPDYFSALGNLASLYQDQNRHSEAIAAFRRAMVLQPEVASMHSNLLFCLLLDSDADPQQVFAEHLAFGDKFEAPLRTGWQPHRNNPDPDRCLQIGIVSGDLWGHAIASFLEPVLAGLAPRPGLCFHAYSTNGLEDAATQRLRGYFAHWNQVVSLSDDALADKIRADGIDILIDLSGHTAKNRLLTFARKPAPVQISWMGYPGSTGLRAMDYYFSDRFFTPPGLLDDQFTEKLVQLPASAPFQMSEHAPPVNELPALRNGFITFGSFNRPNKISHAVVALWSRILLALPDAQILLGAMPQTDSVTLIGWFEDEGIVRSRLQFHPKTNMAGYLALHHQVDICLDTFPYNGGTTTFHALSMGVPTLSLAGLSPVSRSGASILGQVGLSDFVAHDPDDVVRLALHWAGHLPELAQLRAGLRERLAQSPVGHPAIVAAGLDRAWRSMWQRWCAGLAPQSFEVSLQDLALDTNEIAQIGALFKQERFDELERLARAMTRHLPDHGYGWKVLGAVLSMQANPNEAMSCLQNAVRLLPGDAEALNNLGSGLLEAGRPTEAETMLHRALAIRPEFAEAYGNLGNTLYWQDRLSEAETCYQRALAIGSDFYTPFAHLAVLLLTHGRHDEAVAALRRAVAVQPGNDKMHSTLLFALLLDSGVGPQHIFAEHLAFGDKFEAPLRTHWQPHRNNPDPDRCLQIGIVSGDLWGHSIASFLEPVLAGLAPRPGLCFHAYSTNGIEDATTRRLRGYFAHWNQVVSLSDDALADKIRADGIDILIDLSGHTAKNRLLTFARKPAPVQMSWMGYPGSTGLRAMDYYFSDRFFTPPGLLDDQFTEKLVQLPASAPFQMSEHAPPVNELPALRNGFITFGSFNRPNKISRSVVALWSHLLRSLPNAQMLLGAMPQTDSATLIGWFEGEGITRERLRFHPKTDMAGYLALHHQVDICLDTFPYNGGTTTFHALSMGVPTLSLAGLSPVSRSGASILGQVGLSDFVAHDPDDVVRLALHWAGHLPELAQLRAGLRERLAQSPVGHPAIVAAGLDRAWRSMWQRWCAGLAPQSFEVSLQDLALDTNQISL